MTYKEKLKQLHPQFVDEIFLGGCYNCPGHYFEGPKVDDCGHEAEEGVCRCCWEREWPETSNKTGENVLKVMLDDGAIMPTRAHAADAGLDLYAPHDVEVPGCVWVGNTEMKAIAGPVKIGTAVIDTGVHVAIPAGCVGMVKSKSGLNINDGITSEGVIDSGYTGSIRVKLYNHCAKKLKIKAGQKISQLVILPCLLPDLEQVDSMEETERGDGGFGSTGAF